MNSNKLSERLAGLERDRAAQVETLDAKARVILAALPGLARIWIEREVKSCVTSSPTITEKLRGEKLSHMKSEMTAVFDSLPTFINENVGRPDTWPHKNEETLNHLLATRLSGDRRDGYWLAIFRKSVSKAGDFLGRNGYLGKVDSTTSPWRMDGTKYLYATGLSIGSPEITSYGAGLDAAVSNWESIQKTKGELRAALASEAWDQA